MPVRGRALASLGLIGLAQGDYQDASAAFAESLALLRAEGDTPSIALVLSKYGATRLMIGDLDFAWNLVEEGYALAQPLPLGIIHSFVTSWRGWVARARGDMATARFMHEENLRIGHALKNRTTIGHGHAFLAAVDLADGRVDDAFTHFCEALPYHIELGDGWGLALDLEGLSACAALRSRYADAVRLMGAVDALRERSAVALPASDAADRAQRTTRLREKLGDAFDTLYAEGRTLSMDAVVALATDASVMHTSEFRVPAFVASGRDAEVKREGLRVSALGPLQVSIGGRTVDATAWGSARPRELLVCLLMHPEGKTKEQVGLVFWPDASAAQVRNNFHVTLHRLRKVLGNANWVALTGDRYRIDPEVVDEFDVAAFEREVESARRALVRGGGAADVAALERALARYRGDFLDGEPVGDWHLEHRDRLQRVYVDALMELGGRYVEDERHAKAADVFRRVLARDELHEEALRALMRSLAESGERSQALRAYRHFSARLREELEAEPENETTQLSEQLQSSTS